MVTSRAFERRKKPIRFREQKGEERIAMRKLVLGLAALVAFAVAASAQTSPPPAAPAAPAPTPAAPAAAPAPAAAAPAAAMPVTDATPYFVNIVELQINPSSMTKFMDDLSDDVKGTLSETGVREIDSNVGQKDPNHVLIFKSTIIPLRGTHIRRLRPT
jgi:hypothetical protein